MKTIYQLQQIANRLRQVTEVNSISPEDTFGLQSDILEYLADMEQNAEGLGIHKVYASYAEMVADASAPVGSNGKALRFGQLVVIYNSANATQAESGNVYAWQKGNTGAAAWLLMGNLGSVLGNPQNGYHVCDTAAATAEKEISATGYVLSVGGSMKVKMTNANTVDNATLNINSTGAKALYYAGERASSINTWEAGETVEIYYDGTSYYANNVAGGSSSGDGAFDVSAKYPTSGVDGGNTYTLDGALAVLNANLSANKKKGGMSIKFIQSSDNKYVQYFLTKNEWSLSEADWEKTNLEEEISQLEDKLGDKIDYHQETPTPVITPNSYVEGSNGTITANDNYDVVAIDLGEAKEVVFVGLYVVNPSASGYAFYDENGGVINSSFFDYGASAISLKEYTLFVPENAAVLKVSRFKSFPTTDYYYYISTGESVSDFVSYFESKNNEIETRIGEDETQLGELVKGVASQTNNILDLRGTTDGYQLSIYGTEVPSERYCYSKRLQVTPGEHLYFHNCYQICSFKNGVASPSNGVVGPITSPWTVPEEITEIVTNFFIEKRDNPVDYPYISVGVDADRKPYGYEPKTSTGVDEASTLPPKSKDVYSLINDRIFEHTEENAEYLAAEVDEDNRCYRSISKDKEEHYLPQVFKDKVILSKQAYNSLVESAYNFGIPEVCELEFGEKVAVFSAEDEEATTMDDIRAQNQIIVKVSKDMYYMYYFAYGTEGYRPWDSSTQGKKPYNTLFAYSTDGVHWTRGFPQGVTPPFGNDYPNSIKFLDDNMNVMQSHYGSVLKVEDSEYPWRMISSEGYLIMFKSADGFTWVNPVVIDNTQYRDTLSGVEYRSGVMKIYTRGWSGNYPPGQTNGYGSRMLVVLYCDKDGNLICPAVPFASRASNYNAPLSIIDDRRVLLLPTLYQGDTVRTVINGYIVDGAKVNKIPIDNDFLLYNEDAEEGEQENYWKYISFVGNSFCENGKLYMYYNVGNQPHNTWATDNPHVVCKLYRVEIKLKSKVITNIENLV